MKKHPAKKFTPRQMAQLAGRKARKILIEAKGGRCPLGIEEMIYIVARQPGAMLKAAQ